MIRGTWVHPAALYSVGAMWKPQGEGENFCCIHYDWRPELRSKLNFFNWNRKSYQSLSAGSSRHGIAALHFFSLFRIIYRLHGQLAFGDDCCCRFIKIKNQFTSALITIESKTVAQLINEEYTTRKVYWPLKLHFPVERMKPVARPIHKCSRSTSAGDSIQLFLGFRFCRRRCCWWCQQTLYLL